MRTPELHTQSLKSLPIGFDYDYRKINYEREGSVDNELNSFRLTYNRLLSNQVDVFSIFPEFTYGTSDLWDAYNSSLNFRLTHRFDPTLRGSFRVGVEIRRLIIKTREMTATIGVESLMHG